MRKKYKDEMKNYLRGKLLETREKMGLTQEEMADLLEMSTRSYSDIERGKTTFGMLSFNLFAVRCDVDLMEMLNDIWDILNVSRK